MTPADDPCRDCDGDCRGPDCIEWDGDEPDNRGRGRALVRGWD